jgi:DNA-binding NarL/FixJ family response regulator
VGELTVQELQVARLIARGSSNREISRDLRVSEKTVEGHLTSIYRKLALHSLTELAALVLTARTQWADGAEATAHEEGSIR